MQQYTMHVVGAVDGSSVWEVCHSCWHAVTGASAVSKAQVAGSPALALIGCFAALFKLRRFPLAGTTLQQGRWCSAHCRLVVVHPCDAPVMQCTGQFSEQLHGLAPKCMCVLQALLCSAERSHFSSTVNPIPCPRLALVA